MTQLTINLQGSLANPNLALEAAKRNDLASLPPDPTGRIDLRAFADAQASGVAATCITVGHVVGPGDPVGRTRDDLRSWQDFFQCRGNDIPLVLNAGDIEQCASKR